MSQHFDIAVNTTNEILFADWGHDCMHMHVFMLDGQYINNMTIYNRTGSYSLELKKPCSLTRF